MIQRPTKVVFDCVVYAQAIMSETGAAARCLDLARNGEFVLIWSDYIMGEIRTLPGKLPRKFAITDEQIDAFIADVALSAQWIAHVPEIYVNPFDPKDSHYIDLAVTADASVITSRDNDLLRLMDDRRPEGRLFKSRFPTLSILPPDELLERLAR